MVPWLWLWTDDPFPPAQESELEGGERLALGIKIQSGYEKNAKAKNKKHK